MEVKTIGLCADHAGYALKEYVKLWLNARGWGFRDFGTFNAQSCDYPDFGHPLAQAVEKGEVYPGIAICGTGNGINMTMNKYPGIRAALCWNPEICEYARRHNDANVLVLPGRYISPRETDAILEMFFNSDFEGGRHERRIKKIPITPQE